MSHKPFSNLTRLDLLLGRVVPSGMIIGGITSLQFLSISAEYVLRRHFLRETVI
jgi:hypothetical protein